MVGNHQETREGRDSRAGKDSTEIEQLDSKTLILFVVTRRLSASKAASDGIQVPAGARRWEASFS